MKEKKWQKSHTNMRLLRFLRDTYGLRRFTNKEVYGIYHTFFKHWIWDGAVGDRVLRYIKPGEITDWYWEDAAVRNYLCHAAYHKVMGLKRIKPGVYTFTK